MNNTIEYWEAKLNEARLAIMSCFGKGSKYILFWEYEYNKALTHYRMLLRKENKPIWG